MSGPCVSMLLWTGGFAVPLIEVGLALSAIEYAVAAYLVGRGVHGHRMRAWARRHGWSWESRDRSGRLVALQPADLAAVRKRHVRGVIRGDTPQGTFTLYLYRRGWLRKRGGAGGVCVMHAPYRAPDLVIRPRPDAATDRTHSLNGTGGFHDRYDVGSLDPAFALQVLGNDLGPFIAAHPELTWQWKGDELVVTARSLDGPDSLQALVRATDRFRALAPLAPPTGISGASDRGGA